MMKDKTDSELAELAKSLYSSIEVIECFSTSDLVRYELACRELEKRGYKIEIVKSLSINPEDMPF